MDICTFMIVTLTPCLIIYSRKPIKQLFCQLTLTLTCKILIHQNMSEYFLNDLPSNSLQARVEEPGVVTNQRLDHQVLLPTPLSNNSQTIIDIFCNKTNPTGQSCNFLKQFITYIGSFSTILYTTIVTLQVPL